MRRSLQSMSGSSWKTRTEYSWNASKMRPNVTSSIGSARHTPSTRAPRTGWIGVIVRSLVTRAMSGSEHPDGMIHDAVVEIAVEVVRGPLVRLGLAEGVGGAGTEDIVAGNGRPVDVPAHPGLLEIGLAQPGRLPGLAAVQAHVDLADAALADHERPPIT